MEKQIMSLPVEKLNGLPLSEFKKQGKSHWVGEKDGIRYVITNEEHKDLTEYFKKKK